MNKLTIISQNGAQVIDSREVAEMVNKRHDHLMRDIKNYCKIICESTAPNLGVSNGPNFGVVDFFIESTYQDNKGETRPCYLLTKKGCDMVANKMTGEKGVLFTAAYVTAFEHMREALQPKLPGTYLDALKALVASEEEKQKLLDENTEMKPHAILGRAITTANTSILVGDLAKILRQNGVNIGGNRLFDWLRNNGYLIKRKGTDWNMPTQKAVDMGLFEIKESVHIDGNGCNKITRTTKITGKGQQYFINKFLV